MIQERLWVEVWKSAPEASDPWQTKIGNRLIESDPPVPAHEYLRFVARETRNELRDWLSNEPELKQSRVVARVVFETAPEIVKVIGFFGNREQYGWEWHPARPEIQAVGKASPPVEK